MKGVASILVCSNCKKIGSLITKTNIMDNPFKGNWHYHIRSNCYFSGQQIMPRFIKRTYLNLEDYQQYIFTRIKFI